LVGSQIKKNISVNIPTKNFMKERTSFSTIKKNISVNIPTKKL